jgi:hypothetical protein
MEPAPTATIAPPARTAELASNPASMSVPTTAIFSAQAAQAPGPSVFVSTATDASANTAENLTASSAAAEATEIVVPRFTPRIREALQLLADAAACAQDVGTDIWQFSVELAALRRAGLTANECRWLVAKGLARHAREVTTSDSDRRVFQNYANLALSKRTCFVIAERGVVYANALLRSAPRRRATDARDSTALNRRRPAPEANSHPAILTPTWDSDRQQLRVGRVIVKEFKVPAANQEAILAAFQEEGWVPRIDDPLAPQLNQDSKRRLHDTINSLNRNQKHALLRFLGDGKGEGVRWEFANEPPATEEPRTK